jgi:hypothetical protein
MLESLIGKLLWVYKYRKNIFFILLVVHFSLFVGSHFYVLFYKRQLLLYNKEYEKIHKYKKKIYTLFTYNTVATQWQ